MSVETYGVYGFPKNREGQGLRAALCCVTGLYCSTYMYYTCTHYVYEIMMTHLMQKRHIQARALQACSCKNSHSSTARHITRGSKQSRLQSSKLSSTPNACKDINYNAYQQRHARFGLLHLRILIKKKHRQTLPMLLTYFESKKVKPR